MNLFEEFAILLVGILKNNCPKDTYQLVNSIYYKFNGNKYEVVIGEGVTDPYGENYTPYTNEAWSHGSNPNEKWIEDSIKQANTIFAAKHGGATYGV